MKPINLNKRDRVRRATLPSHRTDKNLLLRNGSHCFVTYKPCPLLDDQADWCVVEFIPLNSLNKSLLLTLMKNRLKLQSSPQH